MKPICVKCGLFFKTKKIGYYFEEGMPTASKQPLYLGPNQTCTPGRESWAPYKLWVGDLYECPGCGAQVIAGVPSNPIAEHYMPDYPRLVGAFKPVIRINDCP